MPRENNVSRPPIESPLLDKNGKVLRVWAIWFRDLYARTSYKGGNSIDDNLEAIEETIVQVAINTVNIANNTTAIASNATAIASNATDIANNTVLIGDNTTNIALNAAAIAQNVLDIAQNVLDISTNASDILINAGNISTNATNISTNTTNIGTNTTNIATNVTDIATNVQDILNLEHRVFGDARPTLYDDTGTSYTKGDYVVNPDADLQNYYVAREDIAAPAGVFDTSKWSEVSLINIRDGALDNFVKCGYGAVSYNTSSAMANITAATWQTLQMNISTITTPERVSYDFALDAMQLYEFGLWESSINISMEFDSAVAVRYLYIRLYNVTKATVVSPVFNHVVPSNSDSCAVSFTFPADIVEADRLDKFVIQISGNTTFTTVTQNESLWHINHISKARYI